MNTKTYTSTAANTLAALQDISAKLDRLIDLIADTRRLAGTRNIVSHRRRPAS